MVLLLEAYCKLFNFSRQKKVAGYLNGAATGSLSRN